MPQNEPVGQPASAEVVKNASQKPRIYYGLHFYPGVAQYPGLAPNGEPKRLLVTEEAIRNMEPSFVGCPVHVEHTDKTLAEDLAVIDEADGYVVRSFYNEADGKHWVEFIIKSDRGHEAIARGMRLSNAYRPTQMRDGGVWNSVPYEQEVVAGEFQHLALVEVPRYNESIILTPEEFHIYNKQKLEELARARVRNSSKEKLGMFGLFKKTPIESDSEMLVTLKNGQNMTLEQLVNSFDALISKKNDDESPETQPTSGAMGGAVNEGKEEPAEDKKEEKKEEGEKPLADLSHHVEINGEKLSVGELVARHQEAINCMNALSAHHARLTAKNAAAPDDKKDEEGSEDKKNSAELPDAPLSEEAELADFFSGLSPNARPNFLEQVRNAEHVAAANRPAPAPATSGVSLGLQRYGRK